VNKLRVQHALMQPACLLAIFGMALHGLFQGEQQSKTATMVASCALW
jgi:hypothetical protein